MQESQSSVDSSPGTSSPRASQVQFSPVPSLRQSPLPLSSSKAATVATPPTIIVAPSASAIHILAIIFLIPLCRRVRPVCNASNDEMLICGLWYKNQRLAQSSIYISRRRDFEENQASLIALVDVIIKGSPSSPALTRHPQAIIPMRIATVVADTLLFLTFDSPIVCP